MDASISSDHEAFRVVTTGYYRNPDAQLAAGALRHWLRLLVMSDKRQKARRDERQEACRMTQFYVFARISQVSEAARDAFEPILRAFEGPHAELVQRLLQVANNPTFPNAVQAPIEDSGFLDLLWGEFFVTGQAAPIERIMFTTCRPPGISRRARPSDPRGLDSRLAEEILDRSGTPRFP